MNSRVRVGDLTLDEVRRELVNLTALAGSADRPKPTRINGPDSPMPGYEWVLDERTRPYGNRPYVWIIRTLNEQDVEGGLVYLSWPDSLRPGEDFFPMYTDDVRRLATILLAAADQAEHAARGITRLEDR